MVIYRLIFSKELYSWFPKGVEDLSPIEYKEILSEAQYMLSASLVEQFGEQAILKAKRIEPKPHLANLLDIIVIDSAHMENVA